MFIGNLLLSIDYNAIKLLFINLLGKDMCFCGMIIVCICQYSVYCHPPTIMWLGLHINIDITTPYLKQLSVQSPICPQFSLPMLHRMHQEKTVFLEHRNHQEYFISENNKINFFLIL